MDFLRLLSVDNWLNIISLVFVCIGGMFVYFQWNRSIQIRRAEFLHQLLEKLRFDDKMVKSMYIIDYKLDWYDISFHGNEIEEKIDKLLSYADYVCYLRQTKNISKKEFHIFDYEIHRICISPSCQCYLWNLYHFSLKNNTMCSFYNLIYYGIKHKLLPSDFKSNKKLYTKTLNW